MGALRVVRISSSEPRSFVSGLGNQAGASWDAGRSCSVFLVQPCAESCAPRWQQSSVLTASICHKHLVCMWAINLAPTVLNTFSEMGKAAFSCKKSSSNETNTTHWAASHNNDRMEVQKLKASPPGSVVPVLLGVGTDSALQAWGLISCSHEYFLPHQNGKLTMRTPPPPCRWVYSRVSTCESLFGNCILHCKPSMLPSGQSLSHLSLSHGPCNDHVQCLDPDNVDVITRCFRFTMNWLLPLLHFHVIKHRMVTCYANLKYATLK